MLSPDMRSDVSADRTDNRLTASLNCHTRLWLPVLNGWHGGVADNEMMKLRVECYAGTKADERPVRFQLDGRDYLVEELLDQWHGPDGYLLQSAGG